MTRKQMLQAQAERILDEESEEGSLCRDHLVKMGLWADANPIVTKDALLNEFYIEGLEKSSVVIDNLKAMLKVAEDTLLSIKRNSCCNLCECSSCLAHEALLKLVEMKKNL